MNMLVLWESLERVFSIVVADSDVGSLTNMASIVDFIAAKQVTAVQPDRTSTKSNATPILERSNYLGQMMSCSLILRSGCSLRVATTWRRLPLLREIGNLRWQHMSAIAEVPSKDVVDEAGDRLYPTFFYVEVVFPPSRPMATYGENDHLTVVSTLRRFGLSMLDGEHYLFPAHWPESRKHPRPPQNRRYRKASVPTFFEQLRQAVAWRRVAETVSPQEPGLQSNSRAGGAPGFLRSSCASQGEETPS